MRAHVVDCVEVFSVHIYIYTVLFLDCRYTYSIVCFTLMLFHRVKPCTSTKMKNPCTNVILASSVRDKHVLWKTCKRTFNNLNGFSIPSLLPLLGWYIYYLCTENPEHYNLCAYYLDIVKAQRRTTAGWLILPLTIDVCQSCAADGSNGGCRHNWHKHLHQTNMTLKSVSSLLGNNATLDSLQYLVFKTATSVDGCHWLFRWTIGSLIEKWSTN